jgi:hypothetical protein
MERIQVLVDPEEKERFQRMAQERGVSLSTWLREAGSRRADEESRTARIRSVTALRAFFAACDAREEGREPEWGEHLAVLDASKQDGAGDPSTAARALADADGARRAKPARKSR